MESPSSDVDPSDLFSILANFRRRALIDIIAEDGTVGVKEATEEIARRENDAPDEVYFAADQEYKRVYASLQQNHLEKMEGHGIIETDRKKNLYAGPEFEATLHALRKGRELADSASGGSD